MKTTKIYAIYQISGTSENARMMQFMPLRTLKTAGIKPSLDNYLKVYEGECDTKNGIAETLEEIFMKFNVYRPLDFKGHSLSVSDVVELDGKFYYCDRHNFVNINL